MVTLRGKRDPLRLFGRRLLLAALAILVISALWEVWSVWGKERESGRLAREAEVQLADLEVRQAALQSDLSDLETNRGREAALRREYAMGQTGEGLIVIVEPERPQPVAATSSLMQWLKDMFSHW